MDSRIISGKSYAKINLFLYNLGKREDGYHELYTLFRTVNLFDIIEIRQSKKTSLSCNISEVPVSKSNIMFKVDKILRQEYGLKDKFKIDLIKNIPVGSGMGGGSSNACTYLQMVNKISGLNLSIDQMHEILARIGSDTAFFLYSPAATARGRGEILTPFNGLPEIYIIIINPGIPISAKDVFSSKKLQLTTLSNINMIAGKLVLSELLNLMRNDLEDAVSERYPVINDLKGSFYKSGALKALMSGSGPTVFGIYGSPEAQNNAYDELKSKYPPYLVAKV